MEIAMMSEDEENETRWRRTIEIRKLERLAVRPPLRLHVRGYARQQRDAGSRRVPYPVSRAGGDLVTARRRWRVVFIDVEPENRAEPLP